MRVDGRSQGRASFSQTKSADVSPFFARRSFIHSQTLNEHDEYSAGVTQQQIRQDDEYQARAQLLKSKSLHTMSINDLVNPDVRPVPYNRDYNAGPIPNQFRLLALYCYSECVSSQYLRVSSTGFRLPRPSEPLKLPRNSIVTSILPRNLAVSLRRPVLDCVGRLEICPFRPRV